MIKRAAWPTLGYLRHLLVVYVIAWGALGLAAVIAINFWFAPFATSVLLLAAILGAMPFVYRRWHGRRAISIAGE